jgi:hypothetical protein
MPLMSRWQRIALSLEWPMAFSQEQESDAARLEARLDVIERKLDALLERRPDR